MRRSWTLALIGLALCSALSGCGGGSLFSGGSSSRPAKAVITPANATIIEITVPHAPKPESAPGVSAPSGPMGMLLTVASVSAHAGFQSKQETDTLRDLLRDAPPGTTLRYMRSEGAGLNTSDASAFKDFKADVPSLGSTGSNAGGDLSVLGGAFGFVSRKLNVGTRALGFYIIGGLLAAIGAFAFTRGARQTAYGLVVAGAVIAAVGYFAQNAEWAIGLAGLVVVGVIVWNVHRDRVGTDAQLAMVPITKAIDDFADRNPDQLELVKALKASIKDKMRAAGNYPRLNRAVDWAKARGVGK